MLFPPGWTKCAYTLILILSAVLAYEPPKIPEAPSDVVWVSPAGYLYSLDKPLNYTANMEDRSSELYKNISSSVCENARIMLSTNEVFKQTWKECFTISAYRGYYTIMIYFKRGPLGKPPFNMMEQARNIANLIDLSVGSQQYPYYIDGVSGIAYGGTSPMILTNSLLLACLLLTLGIRLLS